MDRDTAIAKLKGLFPSLRERYGISSLGVFGSVARGDAEPGSDVDILIAFPPDAKYTLFTLGGIANALEEGLGCSVDVVIDHAGLRPRFRAFMEEDLIRVA